ncbi:anhydro-N-acetylmuramic acid kinase [soil metagenome]
MGSMLSIGLMSGTSLDGIDAALIETDGVGLVRPIAFRCEQWSDSARAQLAEASRQALTFERPRASPALVEAGALVDRMHILAVRKLIAEAGVSAEQIGVIGYHGQTVAHRPERGWTWQIGDGAILAESLKITTVSDFRSNDVAQGGQGAPLLPVYHRALVANLPKPVAVLNLGGVGNITWIGDGDAIVAFDTGPANSLIDDWVAAETGARFDENGAMAGAGRVDEGVLAAMLDNPFFDEPPPKSLDRSDFSMQPVRGLAAADGAATLTAFTAESVALALRLLPSFPTRIVVAGGGRHNPVLMAMLSARCGVPVEPIETLGADGDATEAQGFAYMAVRVLAGLPISFPGTTGIAEPLPGGIVNPVG